MRTVRLGDVAEIRIGRTPSRSNPAYWGAGYPWASIADLKSPVIHETNETITDEAVDTLRMRPVKAGTLLYSFKLTIGKMAFAGMDLFTNEAIAALTPRSAGELDARYLRIALMTIDATDTASAAVKGRTLNSAGIANLAIPMPSQVAQHRMINLVEGFEQRAVALASDLLSNLGAIEALADALEDEHWSHVIQLGCTEVALRHAIAPRNEIVHPRDQPRGHGRFVGLEHIERRTGRRLASTEIDLATLTGRKARFEPGDVVYGYLRPYLNKVWLAEFDGYCSVDQYVFKVNASSDPEYIAQFLRSPLFMRRAPVSYTPGQLPRIRTEEVLGVQLPVPPIADQRRIAAELRGRLATIDQMTRAIDSQLEAIEALPAALLRRAFEGIEAA